jgi:subtilisin family serine protease
VLDVITLLSALLSSAVVEGEAPFAGPTSSFVVLDGGVPRVVVRGPVPGTDERPAPARYVDPATGRAAPALVGRGVIARVNVEAVGNVDDARMALEALGVVVVRPLFVHAGLWLVQSPHPDEDGAALAARLAHDGFVGTRLREAFPDLTLRHRLLVDDAIDVPPDDPSYPAQFFLADLDMEDAWTKGQGSADVVVAVVDNGCDLAHPDLAAKLDPGHDVFDDDADPSYAPGGRGNEHGTACAGLVAAVTDNGVDVAGACPLCRATCTRLLGDGAAPLNADVRAFSHAFEDDVDVVSNSWGFVDAIPVPRTLAAAIEDVQQNGRGGRGAVVVFASGNDNREIADDELLAVAGVLGVGAVNNLGELTQFSNRGRAVDVVAPTGTTSTDIQGAEGATPGDVTFTFGGTSSACPLVAGVAGLVLGAAPDLTADEVNALLEDTARQSVFATPDAAGHDLQYGFGLVQPAAALVALAVPPNDGDDGDDDDDGPVGDGDGDGPVGDGGGDDEGGGVDAGGCGCGAASTSDMLGWTTAALALVVVRRARRTR